MFRRASLPSFFLMCGFAVFLFFHYSAKALELNINTFRQGPGALDSPYISVQSPWISPGIRIFAQQRVVFNYLPLRENMDGTHFVDITNMTVDSYSTLGLHLYESIFIAVTVPVRLYTQFSPDLPAYRPAITVQDGIQKSGPGDMSAHLRLQLPPLTKLLSLIRVQSAIGVTVRTPTGIYPEGSSASLRSDGRPSTEIYWAGEWCSKTSRVCIATNVGAQFYLESLDKQRYIGTRRVPDGPVIKWGVESKIKIIETPKNELFIDIGYGGSQGVGYRIDSSQNFLSLNNHRFIAGITHQHRTTPNGPVITRTKAFCDAGIPTATSYGSPVLQCGVEITGGKTFLGAEPGNADTDHDGIIDKNDKCPYQPGSPANGGCPTQDTDGDGLIDSLDSCPQTKGLVENKGCPDEDTDQDGVVDRLDKCPQEKGSTENDGCPEQDNDKDGVTDKEDKCPYTVGPKENSGCPDEDTDKDGLIDRLDKCKEVAGPESNHGCPLAVLDKTTKQISIASQILFKTGTAKIDPSSYPILLAVAKVMEENPYIRIKIEGHTDNQGNSKKNLALSKKRADAVKRFLTQKPTKKKPLVGANIKAARLQAQGFGDKQPIAPNDTNENRAKNRRVVFQVID